MNDNIISGSIVEPQATITDLTKKSGHKKTDLWYIIIMLIEAIAIIILAISLAFSITSSNVDESDDDDVVIEDDSDDVSLDSSISMDFMRLYVASSSGTPLQARVVTSTICQTSVNIFNEFSETDTVMANPCENSQIKVSSANTKEERFYDIELSRTDIIIDEVVYTFYFYQDFDQVAQVEINDEPVGDVTVVKVVGN